MEKEAAATSNPKEAPTCQECGRNPSKYRCPGCHLRSCSLPCVKAHKKRTSCTGKRDRTQFVPLSKFDDNLLISDYNLLEEAKRVAEASQRRRNGWSVGYPSFRLPHRLYLLRNAASKRRTRLLFLPSGMTRREKNQSRYDQRKESISWTIEWRFHSTNVVLLDHRVDENTNLCSIIEKHLVSGPLNHQLKPFCKEPLEHLKLFIQINPKGSQSPFRELDIKAPIREQLAGITIVEYPVIHVFLPSDSYDFDIIRDSEPSLQKVDVTESVSNDQPSPKGVLFREEEIEEDGMSSDTQIFDLLKYINQEPMENFQSSNVAQVQERGSDEEDNQSSEIKLSGVPQEGNPLLGNELRKYTAEGKDVYFDSIPKDLRVAENVDFDFSQDLRDAYSGLIEQANPDGFLDLEGQFDEEMELEGIRDALHNSGMFSMEEELEEGEIPGF
ncbi:PREDICTED: box C/D snoRNA protein 1 [Nelumbo nucifera]|uniref:Box C/D snoRNA protein 1 n=1 Tax=Nelumbo nucifera TaxID=4432 RepID=A0A1U8BIG7_NELNU|nr:PREDICTED: box C/D snoRNA protein 1 [Nelumbo nucifera]